MEPTYREVMKWMLKDFEDFQETNGGHAEESYGRLIYEYEKIMELGETYKLVVLNTAFFLLIENDLKDSTIIEEFIQGLEKYSQKGEQKK